MYNLFCSIRKEDVEIAVDCWSRFFGADSGFGMETPYGICVNDMVASDHERIMGLKDALKEEGISFILKYEYNVGFEWEEGDYEPDARHIFWPHLGEGGLELFAQEQEPLLRRRIYKKMHLNKTFFVDGEGLWTKEKLNRPLGLFLMESLRRKILRYFNDEYSEEEVNEFAKRCFQPELKELGVKNLPEDPPDFSKVVEIFRGLSPESKIYDIAYGLLKFQEYKGKDETELYNYCLNCLKQADLFGPMQFLSDAYIYNHEKRNDT